MREHLHRAKRIEDGVWIHGNLFISDDGSEVQILLGNKTIRIGYDCDKETICEFTGLIDKKGNQIFEGDIVIIDGKYIRYVAYSGECTAFVAMHYIDRQQSEFTGVLGDSYDNYKRQYEVIGNIYDNPDMLEATKFIGAKK